MFNWLIVPRHTYYPYVSLGCSNSDQIFPLPLHPPSSQYSVIAITTTVVVIISIHLVEQTRATAVTNQWPIAATHQFQRILRPKLQARSRSRREHQPRLHILLDSVVVVLRLVVQSGHTEHLPSSVIIWDKISILSLSSLKTRVGWGPI